MAVFVSAISFRRKFFNYAQRLQEKLDKSSSKAHNVSSSLHRMIASDIASLRKTVATRVDTLSREAAELASDVRSLSSQHSELSDTVTTFVARSRADVTDAKAKSSEVARKQVGVFVDRCFGPVFSQAAALLHKTVLACFCLYFPNVRLPQIYSY